ncbi:hypothetical protein AAFF_G00395290 [Aldrovandia affinis]|uniref:Uncharacterized protein n=1 Tax=Aldrovandia affinis TaxID=143900 RepID=A0AAD7R3U6_9TELE|nr:hypothetical protein AAFF_G00395290 [Aldrovandia affinis]
MRLKMQSAPQVLQPVLKMKVDELFLNWLSETATQAMLRDCLHRIKSGDWIDTESGTAANENNNVSSPKNRAERPSLSPSSPSTTTLPSGSGGIARLGSNARALRRSVSTKRVRTDRSPFIHYLSLVRVAGGLEPIPACTGT